MIGLGNMGRALANALLRANYPVTVWNRSPDRAKAFTNTEAVVASNPAAAIASSNMVIVCLATHEAFVSVIQNEEVAERLGGKPVLQLGVVTAEESRQSSDWMNTRDIPYL